MIRPPDGIHGADARCRRQLPVSLYCGVASDTKRRAIDHSIAIRLLREVELRMTIVETAWDQLIARYDQMLVQKAEH